MNYGFVGFSIAWRDCLWQEGGRKRERERERACAVDENKKEIPDGGGWKDKENNFF